MDSVILINPFAVPAGEPAGEQFLAGWRAAADVMRRQEGFISTALHASLDPAAHFQFVNVGRWASAEHFQRALRAPEFQQGAAGNPYPNFPSLYRVIAE